jgi:hypothetical protein
VGFQNKSLSMLKNSLINFPVYSHRTRKINRPNLLPLFMSMYSIFVNYWQLLKKNTNVEVVTVNNTNDNIDYNENNFVNNIKNYVNNLSEEDKKFKYAPILVICLYIVYFLIKQLAPQSI